MDYGMYCRNCGFHKSGLKECPKCGYEDIKIINNEIVNSKKTISPLKAAFFTFIGLPGLIHLTSLKKRKKGIIFMGTSLLLIILYVSSFMKQYMKYFDQLLNMEKTYKTPNSLNLNTTSLEIYFYILMFWWIYVTIDAFITAKKLLKE